MRVCAIVRLRSFLDPAFASKGFIRAFVDLGVKAKTRPQERIPLRKHREDAIGPQDDVLQPVTQFKPYTVIAMHL